jgi:hypothetical protein
MLDSSPRSAQLARSFGAAARRACCGEIGNVSMREPLAAPRCGAGAPRFSCAELASCALSCARSCEPRKRCAQRWRKLSMIGALDSCDELASCALSCGARSSSSCRSFGEQRAPSCRAERRQLSR